MHLAFEVSGPAGIRLSLLLVLWMDTTQEGFKDGKNLTGETINWNATCGVALSRAMRAVAALRLPPALSPATHSVSGLAPSSAACS